MASGRVGGSRSKISGAVGSEVYKIVRNPNGSYSQIVQKKGIPTVNTTTPRLQAQRMMVSMVEALMHDLSPVAKISWQSGANKSKSLNAFSSFNLQIVARDCKTNWYGGGCFEYPDRNWYTVGEWDSVGPWMLSSGTLQGNLFLQVLYDDTPYKRFIWPDLMQYYLCGLEFRCTLGSQTLGQFMSANRITMLDSCVLCSYRMYYEYDTAHDESIEKTEHSYIIMKINPSFPMGQVITADNVKDVFQYDTNLRVDTAVARDGKSFVIGWRSNNATLDESFWYYGGFSISYFEGSKKISTSFYKDTSGQDSIQNQSFPPASVFGTWMDERWINPYPSPFE